jgi:hypothetical protein
MFHDKIRLSDDKQYYYEFNATGMYQKGVKMNYLWIKQVSGIIFIRKIIFFINCTHFINLWVVTTIFQKLKGVTCKFQDLAAMFFEYGGRRVYLKQT